MRPAPSNFIEINRRMVNAIKNGYWIYLIWRRRKMEKKQKD